MFKSIAAFILFDAQINPIFGQWEPFKLVPDFLDTTSVVFGFLGLRYNTPPKLIQLDL